MILPLIAASLIGALLLGIVGATLKQAQFRAGPPRWLWFLHWTRVCMCADPRQAHPDGGACTRCGCWQWRPFLVRRRPAREDPPPLPQRRKPVPGLPSDGRPLDDYEREQLRRVTGPGTSADSMGSKL